MLHAASHGRMAKCAQRGFCEGLLLSRHTLQVDVRCERLEQLLLGRLGAPSDGRSCHVLRFISVSSHALEVRRGWISICNQLLQKDPGMASSCGARHSGRP